MKTKKIVIHNDVSHKSGYTYKPGKGYQLFDIVKRKRIFKETISYPYNWYRFFRKNKKK